MTSKLGIVCTISTVYIRRICSSAGHFLPPFSTYALYTLYIRTEYIRRTCALYTMYDPCLVCAKPNEYCERWSPSHYAPSVTFSIAPCLAYCLREHSQIPHRVEVIHKAFQIYNLAYNNEDFHDASPGGTAPSAGTRPDATPRGSDGRQHRRARQGEELYETKYHAAGLAEAGSCVPTLRILVIMTKSMMHDTQPCQHCVLS